MGQQPCCSSEPPQGDYIPPSGERLNNDRKRPREEQTYNTRHHSFTPTSNRQSLPVLGRTSLHSFNSLNSLPELLPQMSVDAANTERQLGQYQLSRPFIEHGILSPPKKVDGDGTVYAGQMKDGIPFGLGRLFLPNGAYFCGTFNEVPQGEGRFITKEGVFYEGQVSKGQAHGKGKLVNRHKGYQYEGQWQNDIPQGFGKQSWKGVSQYKGLFRGGIKEGKGTYQRFGEFQYIGHFQDGLFHGQGKIQMLDSESYDGSWEKGSFNGHGCYKWNNETSYTGYFKDGFKEGEGKYVSKDGQVFEGFWERGKRNGKGRLCRNGKKIEGIWQNDRFVRTV